MPKANDHVIDIPAEPKPESKPEPKPPEPVEDVIVGVVA